MHPEQIKAAIRMKGTTPAAIAANLEVDPSTVGHVIHGRGKSSRVEQAISKITGLAITTLWPERANSTRVNRKNAPKSKQKRVAHV